MIKVLSSLLAAVLMTGFAMAKAEQGSVQGREEASSKAQCINELQDLDTEMRALGVAPPMGAPMYGVGYERGARFPRGELWSLYQAARSLEQRGNEALCLELVAQARALLDEMEQEGMVARATAPLMGGGCRVDTLVDLRVRNKAGENLGHIKDVVIDLDDGKIDYALLSVGGFFDIGDRLFPIPWEAFERAPDGRSFVLPVDKAKLDEAPGFDRDNWPNMEDPEWNKTVQDFYAGIAEE